MTKQRRSFFVDDILHKVMPINNDTTSKNGDFKRKRSISSEDENKKFRSNDETNYSQVVDIMGDEDSCTSDNSNNLDNDSGKLGAGGGENV